jgi:NACalpha-BTF3-like transcription factor
MPSLKSLAIKNPKVLTVDINGQVETINITQELRIEQSDLNSELMKQPLSYHFISSLLNEAMFQYKTKVALREKIFAEIFTNEKQSKDTGYYKNHFKSPSDDFATAAANKSLRYQKALKAEIAAERNGCWT